MSSVNIFHLYIFIFTTFSLFFSCTTQLNMIFIMLINDILTFISMVNTISESLKARKVSNFQLHDFGFYEKMAFHAQLS